MFGCFFRERERVRLLVKTNTGAETQIIPTQFHSIVSTPNKFQSYPWLDFIGHSISNVFPSILIVWQLERPSLQVETFPQELGILTGHLLTVWIFCNS